MLENSCSWSSKTLMSELFLGVRQRGRVACLTSEQLNLYQFVQMDILTHLFCFLTNPDFFIKFASSETVLKTKS